MATFGTVPPEIPRESATTGLAPKFREKVDTIVDAMRAAGYDPVVYETLRTGARQGFLYGFGRDYDDGRGIVTHSKDADETWHGFGLAVDVVSRSKLWGAPEEFWKKLHQLVRQNGCLSGADWDNDGIMDDWDKPHFQWGPPMRRSPSARAARLQQMFGVEAVWKEVGAAD